MPTLFSPYGNSFLWQIHKIQNGDHLWEEMGESQQEYSAEFTRVHETQRTSSTRFSPIDIHFKRERKRSLTSLASIRPAGWRGKDSYLLPALCQMSQGLSAAGVSSWLNFIPLTMPTVGEDVFPLLFKVLPAVLRIKLPRGKLTGKKNPQL